MASEATLCTGEQSLTLEPVDAERLALLCGPEDANLRQIEAGLDVAIHNRGHHFQVRGANHDVTAAQQVLQELYEAAARGPITPERVHIGVKSAAREHDGDMAQQAAQDDGHDDVVIKTRNGLIRGRGPNQRAYLRRLRDSELNFGIGPAGTGKTYLAVASAVEALEREQVQRLILARPAVEAGERLGFLPGDLSQKIDPYLRPLYDALYEMLGFERVGRLIERNVIEIAPLAYMRGRTLNEAVIILDEAQNTTIEQMKMFLTRIGFGSTAVVTGDITQTDLPRNVPSGLRHALKVLKRVEGIDITRFNSDDVVRHELVRRIVNAYEQFESGGDE